MAVKSKSPPKSPRKQTKVQSVQQKSKSKQKSTECPPMEKPKKKKKAPPQAEVECNRPKFYRSPEEKRSYLEQQVVPILMEGLLAVARDQPRDPIGYLEKFWLQDKQRCDIQLPQNIL
ncbi:protein dpy-30 homolog [Drosophila obscura]|uniref:protein dpy-30 homolog n=1 Tax=Drosophila obscura TaxID=7282 RepID=UPI001BB14EF2|nr:protein dpy-30 homolog [Drosophila obscura]